MVAKYSKFFAVLLSFVTLMALNPNMVSAAVPASGSTTSSYDYTDNCLRYEGTFTWSWRFVDTSRTTSYNWSFDSNDSVYDMCANSQVSSGTWSNRGHEVNRNTGAVVYHSAAKTLTGGHTYKSLMTIVGDEVKVNMFWSDGTRMDLK